MTNKQFIQTTFNSLSADIVNKNTEDMVNKLLKQGYTVKVIVHDPVVHTYASNSTSMEYITTIQATLSKKVDIGFKK